MGKFDGGAAFPAQQFTTGFDEQPPVMADQFQRRMTLRDYFAAKAMQAAFAGEGARVVADRDQRYDETNWAEIVAANAYEMADAMLDARGDA